MPLTNRRLRRWFRVANWRYFGGRLPWSTKVRLDTVKGCWADVQQIDGKFIIRIDRGADVCSAVARMKLLHEMAHMAVWPVVTHGREFNAEMQRLAAAGAMKGLW